MSFEGPKFEQNSDNDTLTVKEAFDGVRGAMKESAGKLAFDCADRIVAAEAGFPIKSGDVKKERMDRLKDDCKDALKSYSGKDVEELLKDTKEYKIPEFSNLVRKDQAGKALVHMESIDKYKLALVLVPLGPDGMRDFRQAKKLEISVGASGRVHIDTDLKLPCEQFSYDLEKFIIATIAENRDQDRKEFSIQPYPHTDKDNHVVSKSLIVLNDEQRTKVKDFIMEYFKENL